MSFQKKLAVVTAALSLGLVPGLAMAAPPESNPGLAHVPADSPALGHIPTTPGQAPDASLPDQAKAYGKRCQDKSKKRSDAAPGTKGTPFSQCVKAAAQADKPTQGGEPTA
jgi:hypothetical protein